MDTITLDINEYCDTLKDVQPHLDEAFEDINITIVQLKVKHPLSNTESFQKKLKKIMKYCTQHDRYVEVDYL